jgi:hypothetical protein
LNSICLSRKAYVEAIMHIVLAFTLRKGVGKNASIRKNVKKRLVLIRALSAYQAVRQKNAKNAILMNFDA